MLPVDMAQPLTDRLAWVIAIAWELIDVYGNECFFEFSDDSGEHCNRVVPHATPCVVFDDLLIRGLSSLFGESIQDKGRLATPRVNGGEQGFVTLISSSGVIHEFIQHLH